VGGFQADFWIQRNLFDMVVSCAVHDVVHYFVQTILLRLERAFAHVNMIPKKRGKILKFNII
jgi:hypothetical protein